MTATERLAEIKARAEAATEGPWEWDPPSTANWPSGDENLWAKGDGGSHGEPVVTSWGHDADGIDASDEDRAFIAHARTDVPQLVAALEAVLEIHYAEPFHDEPSKSFCVADQRTAGIWPCPTIQAVNEALGADQ